VADQEALDQSVQDSRLVSSQQSVFDESGAERTRSWQIPLVGAWTATDTRRSCRYEAQVHSQGLEQQLAIGTILRHGGSSLSIEVGSRFRRK